MNPTDPRPDDSPLERAEKLIDAQQLLLANAAAAASEDEALSLIATFVEDHAHGVRCCVFRMEEWGSALWLAAAPSMSALCAGALAMIPVEASSEASGTAAHRRQTVIVEDVASSPLFDGWREVMGSGLNSCVAVPVFGPELEVLGTVAMYSPTRGKPEPRELQLLAFAVGVAAVVITRFEALLRCRRSEARARGLLQNAADVVLLADAGGTIRYMSTSSRPFPGGGVTDLIGRSIWSFVDQAQREWVKSVFRAATKRNDVATQAFRVVREDGEVRWLEVTISNQLKHPGVEAMVLNYRDITDRVTALDRLWQQEEQYRAIVEAVTDGILILDRSGRIVTANTAACDMHGYSFDELIGRAVADLFHESDRPKLAAFLESTASSFYAEAGGVCKDGRALQVVLRGTPFLIGSVPHLLAVVSNVSEHKRMQQRLERSDRISSLGRMAATIAHEMNNVMMGIVPFAEIIRRRTLDDPVLQNATEHILKSADRGKNVTQDIVRFTRATGAPELAAVSAADVVAGIGGELRMRLAAGVNLHTFCEEGLLLLGDTTQLQQVILNLVINAGDSMPDGGDLSLRIVTCSPEAFGFFAASDGDAHEDYVHLCVRDQGHGIPPYLISQIFEPLFTTKGSRGTGLGLAIVHQIVVAHEGQIHVESALDRGTTFHVLLRKAKLEAMAAPVSDTSDVWRSIRSVILVEDELSVGDGLAALLTSDGVFCEWITRGEHALARLQSNPPDLLILDVALPDMSGIEVYREVAKRFPDLPTIFSTGHGDHRLLGEFSPSAPVGFLSKPYGLEVLKGRIRMVLNRTNQQQRASR